MEPLGLEIVVDQIRIGSRTKFQVKIVALHSTSYMYMCMVTVALFTFNIFSVMFFQNCF